MSLLRMKRLALMGALAASACFSAACGDETGGDQQPDPEPEPTFDYPLDDVLRLHHLQTKATHNSYHIEPDGNVLSDWNYTHLPLDQQLDDQGVRQIELDLRYAPALDAFEAYHLPIIDEETTCRLFRDCLTVVKSWSDAHRAHHPIVVQLELKDGLPSDPEIYFAALHAEITSVWPESRIVTPALVRGDASSVGAAIAADGWPTLGELRGKVMFTMDNGGEHQQAYTHSGTSLDGRLLFAQSSPGDPFAAHTVLNNPFDSDAIAAAVSANMLVRTRADSGSVEPEAGDTSRRDAALASGAHFITTDFPAPVSDHDYWVEIPDGAPSRCNPVTAPPECTSLAIEDPAFVGP